MKQAVACLGLVVLLSVAAFSQSPEKAPAFSASDVRSTTQTTITGPFIGGGLYRLRGATMVDLIAAAYSVDTDKVAGGPSWLELNRYDISAKVPGGTSIAMMKIMLQTLLADRFQLAVHNGTAPAQVYGLKAGNKPLLRPSGGSGPSGCKTQPVPGSFNITNGAVSFSCRNMTMEAFANGLPGIVGTGPLNGYRVVDQTDLKGSWDFEFTFRRSINNTPAGEEPLYFSDAIRKQLGIEIGLTKVSVPGLIVDSVNEAPSDNPPNLSQTMPALPVAFEVASIKQSPPEVRGYSDQVQPGGLLNIQGATLTQLILRAWKVRNAESLVGPKFLDSDKFNILARIPVLTAQGTTETMTAKGRDNDLIDEMLRTLMIESFKMVVHEEERPMTAYTLRAVKPKLQKADPSNRAACLRNTGTGGSGAPANAANAVRFTCQNMTMAQFVQFMNGSPFFSVGRAPIQDATGLAGAWDFTMSYTNGPERPGESGDSPTDTPVASTPNGRITLFEALESQLGLKLEATKRPGRVLVIDRMEQKPAQN